MNAVSSGGGVTSMTDFKGLPFAPPAGSNAPVLFTDDRGAGIYFDGTSALVNTTLAINPATAAVFVVVDQKNLAVGKAVAGLRDASGSSATCLISDGTGYQIYWNGASGLQGSPTDVNRYLEMDQHVAGFVNAGGSTHLHVNRSVGDAIANPYSTTSAGFLVGCLPSNGDTYRYNGIIRSLVVLDNPTDADVTAVKQYLLETFPPPPSRREMPLVIVNGNSIAQGVSSTLQATTWWSVGIQKLDARCDWVNVAKAGLTTPNLSTLLPRDVFPRLDKRRPLVVYVCYEAINDMFSGVSPAQAAANTTSHFQAVRAVSPLARIVVPTALPCSQVSPSDLATYNDLIRANFHTYGDVLWDLAADPVMGTAAGNQSNYFAPPGTHLSDSGAAVVGASFAKILQPLFAASGGGRGGSLRIGY